MTEPTLAAYRHPRAVRRVFASLVRVACPPDAAELGIVDDVVHHAELSIASFGPLFRSSLVAGTLTYDDSARFWPPARGRRATALGPELSARWFRTWWKSPLGIQREFARGVKSLLCLGYYEMPAVKEKLGYTPDAWIERVKRYRLQVYQDDIRRHEEELVAPNPLRPAAGDPEERRAG